MDFGLTGGGAGCTNPVKWGFDIGNSRQDENPANVSSSDQKPHRGGKLLWQPNRLFLSRLTRKKPFASSVRNTSNTTTLGMSRCREAGHLVYQGWPHFSAAVGSSKPTAVHVKVDRKCQTSSGVAKRKAYSAERGKRIAK